MLPYEEITRPAVLRLLARYRLSVLVAVRPWTVAAFGEVVRACDAAGVEVAAWPMLDDREGRWASARNAGAFVDLALRVADAAEVKELAIDLEPPIDDVRALLRDPSRARQLFRERQRPNEFQRAKDAYALLVSELRARDVRTLAAALPVALLDRDGGRARWQRLIGTPIDGPPFDHVSVMLYTSMIEGWSRGVFERRHARALLAAGCRATKRRFGARGGVSLGAVDTGAFGDEPVYRSPEELADDVAIARAMGIHDLALFDLAGVLARKPAEAWLDAFVSTDAATELPAERVRTRAIRLAARALGA